MDGKGDRQRDRMLSGSLISWCSGIDVKESTSSLSLTAEISCFLAGSEEVYCPAAALMKVCSLHSAKTPFAPLLPFSCNTVVCQWLFSADAHLHNLEGAGAEFCASVQNAIIFPALHFQFWNTAMAVALDSSQEAIGATVLNTLLGFLSLFTLCFVAFGV